MNEKVATLGELKDVWSPVAMKGIPTCLLIVDVFKYSSLFQLFDF